MLFLVREDYTHTLVRLSSFHQTDSGEWIETPIQKTGFTDVDQLKLRLGITSTDILAYTETEELSDEQGKLYELCVEQPGEVIDGLVAIDLQVL